MEQTKTSEAETEIERRVREMAEADLRSAVAMMKVMNQAFDIIISRVPGVEPSHGQVRDSER